MSFDADMTNAIAKTNADVRAVFVAASEGVFDSLVNGSPVTGSPGQPVSVSGSPNDGELKESFTLTYPSAWTSESGTDVPYADDVEDNINNQIFHNGGPHNQKLTKAGWPAIVEAAALTVARNG